MSLIEEMASKAGLADGGKDDVGQQLWIGTDEQWNEFEKLKQDYEEVQYDEKDKYWPYK